MLSQTMKPSSIDELAKLLHQSQLVSGEEIAQCRDRLGHRGTAMELLSALQSRQLLTPFQVQKINKGDLQSLVLDGCKLMYRNASGSFARVYRAERIEDGSTIGVKLLRDRWSTDVDTVQLFHREGDIGKRLRHPNIVPVYNTGSKGKYHFITMEFVEGGNLRDFIKIRKQLAPEEALKFGVDMALGLQHALEQGITHRDMKTTNVLMSAQGVAKLIDFGLGADDAFLNRPDSPDLAQALEYSTLEKGTNAPRNDPRSDLYFLGVILYELMTGQPPYPRTRDREERKRFGRYRDVQPISNLLPKLPMRVASIVDQLLQVNPAQRYQSAKDVTEDLQQTLRGLGAPMESMIQKTSGADTRTLLCIEHRPKRQDILRDYFTKHNFRVLLLGDAERAQNRLKNNPPDFVIMFGDAVGDRVVQDFQGALNITRTHGTGVLAVMTEEQKIQANGSATNDKRGKVLSNPIRLRDLRQSIEEIASAK